MESSGVNIIRTHKLNFQLYWAVPENIHAPHGRHWKSCKKCLVSMTGNPWIPPKFCEFWLEFHKNHSKSCKILEFPPRSRIGKVWNPAITAAVILGNPVICRYPIQCRPSGGVGGWRLDISWNSPLLLLLHGSSIASSYCASTSIYAMEMFVYCPCGELFPPGCTWEYASCLQLGPYLGKISWI